MSDLRKNQVVRMYAIVYRGYDDRQSIKAVKARSPDTAMKQFDRLHPLYEILGIANISGSGQTIKWLST